MLVYTRYALTTFPFIKQDVSVVEQEKIDKLMLDMDGTDNKCKLILQINMNCEHLELYGGIS